MWVSSPAFLPGVVSAQLLRRFLFRGCNFGGREGSQGSDRWAAGPVNEVLFFYFPALFCSRDGWAYPFCTVLGFSVGGNERGGSSTHLDQSHASHAKSVRPAFNRVFQLYF